MRTNSSNATLASKNRRLAASSGLRPSARKRPATKVPPHTMLTPASFRYTGRSEGFDRVCSQIVIRFQGRISER
ncbi:hypothetical protein D3C75_1125520 [compost metagenome]